MHNNRRSSNHQNQNAMGYVRVLHAVPDAPNVDIYANGNLIVSDLAYSENTEYLPVPEGTYRISVYPAGSSNSPVISNMLTIDRGSMITMAAAGMLENIGLLAIHDANTAMRPGKSIIRFLHLAPDAPAVDITLPNGTVIFSNVSFKQITPYIDVAPMNYTLQVRVAGTSDVVLTIPDVDLSSDEYYTAYAIGLVEDDPQLDALLLMDGQ